MHLDLPTACLVVVLYRYSTAVSEISIETPLKLIQSAEYTLLVFEKKNDSMAINYVLFVSKVSKIPSHI